ncbi:hypothetical protein IWQ62_004065, partial [Dispira parvispora]
MDALVSFTLRDTQSQNTSEIFYTFREEVYFQRNVQQVILPIVCAMFLSCFVNTIWLIYKTFLLKRLQKKQTKIRRMSASLGSTGFISSSLPTASSITATHGLDSAHSNTAGTGGVSQSIGTVRLGRGRSTSRPSGATHGYSTFGMSTVNGEFIEIVPLPGNVLTRVCNWLFLVQSLIGFLTVGYVLINVYQVDQTCDTAGMVATVGYYLGTLLITLCVCALSASGQKTLVGRILNYGLAVVAVGVRVYLLLNALGKRQQVWDPLCAFDLEAEPLRTTAIVDMVIWLAQFATVVESLVWYSKETQIPWGYSIRRANAGCLVAACIIGTLFSVFVPVQGAASGYSIFPCWYLGWMLTSKLVLESLAETIKAHIRAIHYDLNVGDGDFSGLGGQTSESRSGTADESFMLSTVESRRKSELMPSRLSHVPVGESKDGTFSPGYISDEANQGCPTDRLPILNPGAPLNSHFTRSELHGQRNKPH